MEKSAILKILGVSPTGKLLEHFLICHEFDYTVADLHDATKLSRITIEKVIKTMVEDELIIKTRMIGKSQLYKINKKNAIVQKLMEFMDLVIEKQERLIQTSVQA